VDDCTLAVCATARSTWVGPADATGNTPESSPGTTRVGWRRAVTTAMSQLRASPLISIFAMGSRLGKLFFKRQKFLPLGEPLVCRNDSRMWANAFSIPQVDPRSFRSLSLRVVSHCCPKAADLIKHASSELRLFWRMARIPRSRSQVPRLRVGWIARLCAIAHIARSATSRIIILSETIRASAIGQSSLRAHSSRAARCPNFRDLTDSMVSRFRRVLCGTAQTLAGYSL